MVNRFISSVEAAFGAVSGDLGTQASDGEIGFTCRKSCLAIAHHPDESLRLTTIRLYDTYEALISGGTKAAQIRFFRRKIVAS
jgi:hypothetical protein